MNIAIAQMHTVAGDFEASVEHMLAFAQRAKQSGADVAIFPAFAIQGGCPIDEVDQEGFLSDLADAFQRFAAEAPLECIVPVACLFGSYPIYEVVHVRAGEMHALRMESEFEQFRRHLLGADAQDGSETIVCETCGVRMACAFTFEDLDAIARMGHAFDLVLFASTYAFAHDNPSTQLAAALTESRFISDAERMGAWIIAAGSLGAFDTQVHAGGSFVLAPWGELAAEAPLFEEALVTCSLDPNGEGPLEQPLVPDVPDRLLSLMGALIFGLSDFCKAEGVRDVALAMDGSLASSFAATLACDALGPMHVHAVVGAAESPELAAQAHELAARLRIDATDAPEGSDANAVQLVLAELARTSGALVLLDIDKTGLALENRAGTLIAGGLAPLADVYRSDVVALARMRNTISPVIGALSMKAWSVPAIEGISSRYITVQSQMEFIDYVLSGRIEWGRSYTQIVDEDRGGELAAHILELMRIRRLARTCAPRTLVVSSQSLMEMPQAYGLRWHDKVRSNEATYQRFGSFLQTLGAGSAAPSAQAVQRDVNETIAFLRDFAVSGGLFSGSDAHGASATGSSERDRPASGTDPWSFGNPFSEN